VALLPDNSTGVLPFQYQILAGPTTTAQQASPVFPGLSSGTYTFLMADGCGNSYSRNISIDTLTLPSIATSGGTCVGGAVTFTFPSNPYYTYAWQLPHGGTSTGNSISINPITISDTGTYQITVTSSIAGCTNTTSKNYTLNYCIVLAEKLLRFDGRWKGDNLDLDWQTTDETNISVYIVERSTDGIFFTPLQQVVSTYVPMHVYKVTDVQVPSGVVYYRLKMVVKNGVSSYSKILSFNKAHVQPVNVYPRLVKGNTPVLVTYPATNSAAFIQMVSIDGRVLRTVPVPPRSTETSIDVANLATGSYVVVFSANGTVVPIKIWKE
jgi:hypothetical protein